MKNIVLVALVLLSTNFSFAQWDYNRFIGGNNTKSISGGDIGTPNDGTINTNSNHSGGIRSSIVPESEIEEITPLTPATLLLLGLGGATVGGAVYRNSKRKK